MKKRAFILTLSYGFMTLAGYTAGAEEADSFSGTISIGTIFINSANNLNPNSSKTLIYNLNKGADRETAVRAAALPRITWNAGASDELKFHLITDPPIDEAGTYTIDTGVSSPIENIGIIDGGIYVTPFEKVWENPYVTEVDRQETDTTKYGARIGINRIANTGLRIQFVYLQENVDNDTLATLEPELARDGAVYSLNANYSFYFTEAFELRPRLSIRRGEYDGDANSFIKYKAELEARYRIGRIMFTPRLHYSHSDFDETDPIFKRTRKNDGYGLRLMSTFMAPFNFKDWSLTGLIAMSKGNANIDFYDTEAFTCGFLLNYHF